MAAVSTGLIAVLSRTNALGRTEPVRRDVRYLESVLGMTMSE
ncbi:MAG: hypothetical protein QOE78_2758 [Alphaproteobacteria bacterium]|nr:hypothetical protein [Alphaproteobacteria bacterium]